MKKILAFLLAAIMLVCAASCGNNNNKPAETTDAGNTPAIEKIDFPALTYLYNTSEGHKAIGEYLQSAFNLYGVNMKLENQEWATFLNTRKSGDFSVARNGWIADFTDPICFLDMWTSGSGNNDVQFGKGAHANVNIYNLDLTAQGYDIKVENGTWAQTYDVLISTIKGCTDNAKRYELMHIAEDMLMDTGCIVPLYFYTDLYMISSKVKGFYSSPLGYKYFMTSTVEGKNEINVCLASEPESIDPALNSAVDGATLIAHLFQGLAKWAQKDDGSLYIAPDAVEELVQGTVGEDGKVTYVYTLREGLKWSDGQEVKASDYVYSWNRAVNPDTGADYEYMFEAVDGYADGKLNVTADDENRTLTVVLANAISYWDELLAFPTFFPVRKDVVEGNEGWATNPETLICNGPYKVTAWTHDELMVLEKNDNFIDADKVTMPKINNYLSDDANNMLTNFKTGAWDLIDDVPTAEIAALKKDYPTEFVVAGQIGTYYVCWNINADLLPGVNLTANEKEVAQQEIRQALGLILDRNHIVNDIAQGGQVPASSFVAMGMTNPDNTQFYQTAGHNDGFDGYYDVSAEAYAANCAKAEAILAKYYK